ncbi:TIGR00266 family protein [bacterium]|nr:TIGR00266 family protein [bacterium]
MSYNINGSILQTVEISLRQGQRVFSETGGMVWMDPGIELDTAAPGGGKGLLGAIGGALSRAVAGESLFLNYFTARSGPGRVAFASSFPGKIIDVQLAEGQSIIAQRGAFLVGEDSLQLKVEFTRKLGAGLLGGEGFILQRISGPGLCFLEVDGELTVMDLQPGQQVKVDSGHVAAFTDSVRYEIELQKSFKNMLLSGEGLALAVLTGPGRVWIQNLTLGNLAGRIAPYLPQRG